MAKFQGASSISSSAFYNKPEEAGSGEVMDNLKDLGGKLFGKIQGLSGYFKWSFPKNI